MVDIVDSRSLTRNIWVRLSMRRLRILHTIFRLRVRLMILLRSSSPSSLQSLLLRPSGSLSLLHT